MSVLIPHTIDEAVEMLSSNPDAQLLTGGTDFMVEVNFNHRRPDNVIALKKISELGSWSLDHSTGLVRIGAAVPFAEIEKGPLSDLVPALAEAARTVGSPQIRAAGTLAGNLGTCSPAGDSLPVLAALDAVVHLQSLTGRRDVPFHEFMVGPKRNSRKPGEIITAVSIPRANGYQGYAKVGVRNAMVISVASACLAVHDSTVRIALGSVGPTIIRCSDSETWINSSGRLALANEVDVQKEFASRVGAEARPIDDHRSTAQYRRHAVTVLARRLLNRAVNQ